MTQSQQRALRELDLKTWLALPTDNWAMTFSQAELLRRKWLRKIADRRREIRKEGKKGK